MKKDVLSINGITLTSLVVTVIILVILAAVSIYTGRDVVKKAKLEELKTTMLLIQAKSKEYVEQANFKMGVKPEEKNEEEKKAIRKEIYEQGAKLEEAVDFPDELKIEDNAICYWLTDEARENWGIDTRNIEEENKDNMFLIKFDEVNETVEVYSILGYNGKYSLSEIKEME